MTTLKPISDTYDDQSDETGASASLNGHANGTGQLVVGRRSRSGLYKGEVRASARLESFEQRAELVSDRMRDEVLMPLFLNRVMLRRQLAQAYRPLAYGYESLPLEFQRALPDQPLVSELEKGRGGARKTINTLIESLLALELVEEHLVKRNAGTATSKVLRLYGSGSLDAQNKGPAPRLVRLSKDGLRYLLLHYEMVDVEEVDSEVNRRYKFLQPSATRIPHALTVAAIHSELRVAEELGLLEIVEFVVEKHLEADLEAKEGTSEKTAAKGAKKRLPIPRPDVYVRLAPKGRPDLAETVYLEIDRASQLTETQRRHPLPENINPTKVISRKLDNYYALSLRLKQPINLCFIVPEHANVSPRHRAVNLWGDMSRAKERFEEDVKKIAHAAAVRGDPTRAKERYEEEFKEIAGATAVRALGHPLYEKEPTPRNFALSMGELLSKIGQAKAAEDAKEARDAA